MSQKEPHLVVLGGPNGSGKSTTAPALLKGSLGVTEFVNADTIAGGLSAFAPERVAIEAGRIMIRRLRELARQRADFAFESTLASRSFAPWISSLQSTGYRFHLVFLWLSSADEAVARVRGRVRLGGHNVPEDTIRRRYNSGLRNLFRHYLPVADGWEMYDNSLHTGPRTIARGGRAIQTVVRNPTIWKTILKDHGNG